MRAFVVACAALAAFCVSSTVADDPADSWLAFAKAAGNGKKITYINATWIVPSNPTEMTPGNAPGWWFGIEPSPASNLIQPILAWGDTGSAQYSIFNGYYQWDNDDWYQSSDTVVNAGDKIFGAVEYDASQDSYTMTIESLTSGWSAQSTIPVESGKVYTDAYFVTERQPDDCGQYPANGGIVFTDIHIFLDNELVTKPVWTAQQYQPACDSQAFIVSPNTVKFTWKTSGPAR